MDPLEGTTLELIHKRHVSSYYPGYTIILMVLGIIVALPLVKVDVVSTSGGMIRPCQKPVELFSSITGIVDSTLIVDNLEVDTGDTLVWLRKDLPDTRMAELFLQINWNMLYIKDIEAILCEEMPVETTRYMQSNRNHAASCRRLILQKEFLRDEYHAARILYDQQVIPLREFEQARNEYQVSCAQLEDHLESYKNHLEDELNRLWMENRKYEGEVEAIRATLQNYNILAPSTGTLNQCLGINPGSVIQAGTSLGCISSHGSLSADCYVETRDIKEIRTGMPVRLRMDGKSHRTLDHLETRVSQIDPDVMLLNGRPVYRVRCMIGNPDGLIPGMTFSASMMLYRTSVASLMMESLNRHFNPSLALKPIPIH